MFYPMLRPMDQKRALKKQISDMGGGDYVAARLGLGFGSIKAAYRQGYFAASWFDVFEAICRERRLPAPDRGLFNFKAIVDAQEDAA